MDSKTAKVFRADMQALPVEELQKLIKDIEERIRIAGGHHSAKKLPHALAIATDVLNDRLTRPGKKGGSLLKVYHRVFKGKGMIAKTSKSIPKRI